jgi:glycine/D-amino acid oxidase-like deaminating enzyme
VQFQTDSVWWATLNAAERQDLSELPQQPLHERPDVLVVGGGVVGLAVAYFAAEKGWKVQVITDTSRLANDAEGSLGCIFPNAIRWQLSPATQQLAQSSRDWWARLAVRPDFQLDWRVPGTVLVDERHLTPNPRAKMMELLEDGYSVLDVDAEQVAILEPQLKPLPSGGLHFPSEAVLHPLKAAVGLIRGLRRLGGRIATNCQTLQIERQADRISAVVTTAGRIEPGSVVADAWDQLFVPSPETQPQSTGPSSLQQRTFLATAPTSPLLSRPVLGKEWLLQLKTGEIAVEAPTRNSAANDDSVALSETIQSAIDLLPALQSIPLIRTWSATFTTNPDHLPAVDQVPGLSNVWTYHDLAGSQVLLAPMLGRLLIQWMASHQRPEELAPFAHFIA